MLSEKEVVCKLLDDSEGWTVLGELSEILVQAKKDNERLDQVERNILSRLLALGRKLLQSHVEASGDGDEGMEVEHPVHGKLRRSPEAVTRSYQSIFGEFEITRQVYQKRVGQKALYIPLDRQLGLPEQKQSYVLEDWLGRFAIKMPYKRAVETLHELLGIRTSVRSAERIVGNLAKHTDTFQEQLPPPPADTEGEILVLTVDGKGVPMRRGLNKRMHDDMGTKLYESQSTVGYEKTDKRRTAGANKSTKQMVYVAAMYSIVPFIRNADDVLDELARQARTTERPRPKNKRFYAEMTRIVDAQLDEGPERVFGKLAKDAAARSGLSRPKAVVCLMDGQRSLWFRQQEFLPNAVAVLDIFHVIEYLWSAAYCHHPQGSLEAEKYVNKKLRRLLNGKIAGVIRSLKAEQTELKGSRAKEMSKVINYFDKNRRHMRYDEYLREGYPIGSGVVEGACRHVVKDRMELAGMRWEIEGAQSILSLRTTYLNDLWNGLIETRIRNEQQQLECLAA